MVAKLGVLPGQQLFRDDCNKVARIEHGFVTMPVSPAAEILLVIFKTLSFNAMQEVQKRAAFPPMCSA